MKRGRLLIKAMAVFFVVSVCIGLASWHYVSTIRGATFKLYLPAEEVIDERLLLLTLQQDSEVCVVSAYQNDANFLFREGWFVVEFKSSEKKVNRFAIIGSSSRDPTFGEVYSRVGRISIDGFQKGCSKFKAATQIEILASVVEQAPGHIVFDIDIVKFRRSSNGFR